jgi:hypothetical protein
MKIARMTAAAFLAVPALAGCGDLSSSSSSTTGSRPAALQPLSKAAYGTELQQVGRSLVAALNTLGQKPTEFKRIENNVGRGQASLREAAARLVATTPPLDARADNAKLVGGLRYFAAQLPKLKTAAAQHNVKGVIAFDRTLDRSPAMRATMAAASDLQRKGYKLGQLASNGKG